MTPLTHKAFSRHCMYVRSPVEQDTRQRNSICRTSLLLQQSPNSKDRVTKYNRRARTYVHTAQPTTLAMEQTYYKPKTHSSPLGETLTVEPQTNDALGRHKKNIGCQRIAQESRTPSGDICAYVRTCQPIRVRKLYTYLWRN